MCLHDCAINDVNSHINLANGLCTCNSGYSYARLTGASVNTCQLDCRLNDQNS